MRISDWSSDVCSSDLDGDETGREWSRKAAAVLPPGKVHIGEIQGHKDARSALMAGDGKAITNAFFNAEEFKPDGIFTVADLRAAALQPVEWGITWWSPTRSEERRVGKECVSTGRSRGAPEH